ncbi:hypothetical protein MRX96_007750 [Rhipicephalus microplus]
MSVQLDEGVVHETSKHSMLCADNPGDIAVEEEDNGTDIGLRLVEPVALKLSKLDSTKHPQPIISELVQKHDLGLLKFDTGTGKAVVSDAVRTEIVKLGAMYFQNREGPFLPTNNRSMTKSWFKKKLGDGRGEEVTRSWLAYSPAKKAAFCICCLLFSRSDHLSSLEQEGGFTKWKAPEKITLHENAKNHRMCFSQWKEMERNLMHTTGIIDADLQSQMEKEKHKWREILTRVLHCIKFLATQNLALRGHRESFQTSRENNVGNFLGLLKLIAVFDPVMKQHLTYVESHPGSTSYLSPSVQNEFIHMMAVTVRESLLRKIRKAKYYGIMFDTTPDQAHREQMSEVVRYVEVDFDKKSVYVQESFLGFIHVKNKDAESFVDVILGKLEEDRMNLQDCRSQCYDNAAVMAGQKSGVSQRIAEKNKLAIFVNCDNHSLNLVGVHAAKEEAMMMTFFGTIEALYVFFSRSTYRWEKLKNAVPVVVKSESETRWSARVEAVKPVGRYLEKILEVVQEMSNNDQETSETKSDAALLQKRILSYDFLILLGFWNKVLVRIDRVQKRLQDPKMNFHDAALDMKALRDHFHEERETLVSESLGEGLRLCETYDVDVERRARRKKQMPGEKSKGEALTAKQETERVMKCTLDRLHSEIDQRFTRLQDTDLKFGFLLDINKLCYSEDKNELKTNCNTFGNFYSSDVNAQDLYEEILDCRLLLSRRIDQTVSRPEELLKFIVEYGDDGVFPNLRVALQMMLTIGVSIAGCERSFSKLKLILSYLRATMGQDRLTDLALLSVEREETEKTNFDVIIEQFASSKARKVQL